MKKALSILLAVVLMMGTSLTAFAAYENTPTTDEISQREIENLADAQYIATQGMVLMENNGALPISQKAGAKIALYGVGVKNTIAGGTGSGSTNPRKIATVYEAFLDAGYNIVAESEAYLEKVGIVESGGGWGGIGGGGGGYDNKDVTITPEYLSQGTDTAIYIIPRQSGEGSDRTAAKGNYYLSDMEYANLKTVAAHYDKVIVALNIGGIIDMKWFDEINAEIEDGLDSVLLMSQAGQQGGPALVQVLNGEVTPSGKLTDTWALNYEDYPSSETFSSNDGNLINEIYAEGIYNGYRYFDTFGLDVAYEFGYGLSYTNFDIALLDVTVDTEYTSVKVKVTNTGTTYSGKEVVEVYFSAPQGSRLDKPYQELGGYVKTDTLVPGSSQVLTVSYPTTDMSSYDEELAAYILEDGQYTIRVGNSSRNTKIAAVLTLDSEDTGYQITEQLSNQLETVVTDETRSNGDETGYLGDTVLTSWEAPGPIFDKTSAFDNKVALTMDFSDYVVPNNASEYANQTTTTYVSQSNQENFDNGFYWNDALNEYIANDPVVLDHDEEIEVVNDVPEGTRLIDVLKGNVTLEEFVASLTLEELSYISEGYGSAASESSTTLAFGAAGFTTPFYEETRGIPAMSLPDGPAGLRINQKTERDGVTYYQYATAIPIGTCYAQAWDTDVYYFSGSVIGEEMNQFGATLWLAPGLNIHRNPLCGRNFEYYSEDPLVSGLAATHATLGVQSYPGVSVTLKHFAGNQQENARNSQNTSATERTWREIYLKGFEMAVKGANAASIMTSYNKVNGPWASTNYDLNTNILRGEWGFDGLVMTDWGGVHGDLTTITSGNDLVTPGGAGATVYNGMRYKEASINETNGTLVANSFANQANGSDQISADLPADTELVESLYKTTVTIIQWGDMQFERRTNSLIRDGKATVTYYKDGVGTTIVDAELAEESDATYESINSAEYDFVRVTYYGGYTTRAVYVGDLQKGVINILRVAMNSIQMQDLNERLRTKSFVEFLSSDAAQTKNFVDSSLISENGLIDYMPIEKSSVELARIISVPASAYINETFTIQLELSRKYTAVKLVNETGRAVSIQDLSISNRDGINTWNIDTAVGTAGTGRTLTVLAKTMNGDYEDLGLNATLDILAYTSSTGLKAEVVSAKFAKAQVAKNAPVQVTVVTNSITINVNILNENNKKIGKTLISKTVANGQISWVYEISVGTAGARVFTFQAAKFDGIFTDLTAIAPLKVV